MQDISLHLLDIIENSAQAQARLITILIRIDKVNDRLSIEIIDNGKGMDRETLYNAQQPFFTTKAARKKKIGLGIPLFKQNAEQCDGFFELVSEVDKGTSLKAVFRFSHIDRMPLGNITDTILTSILGHPDIDYKFDYSLISEKGEKSFCFDTTEIRKELGDIPLNYPDVIGFITGMLSEGIGGIYVEEF